MIDLETGGTEPGCQIFSIGALWFNPETDRVFSDPEHIFYVEIERASYTGTPFWTSANTMEWWEHQDLPIPDGHTSIRDALLQFDGWLHTKHFQFWANSPRFDVAILERAYKLCDINWPFQFHLERDVRTVRALAGHTTPLNNQHHALKDAFNQALIVNHCYKVLGLNNDHLPRETPMRNRWRSQPTPDAS